VKDNIVDEVSQLSISQAQSIGFLHIAFNQKKDRIYI
jgi:hypothetical protein